MFRFYDDELHNLILVANRSVREIISYLSGYDYHPPLQYIVNKISLELFGLNEFWLKFPSIIFILSSILICSLLVLRLTGSVKAGFLSGIISIINPLVLLWGTSLRWYPLWTFLTIYSIYLTVILFTDSNKSRRFKIQILLTVTITLALYTNYQSIITIITILITTFILDIKEKSRRFVNLKRILPVLASTFILFLPYMGTFLHHLNTYLQQKQNSSGLSYSSILLSGGYYLFSVFFGNSIYPWDISFIIFISLIVICVIAILIVLIFFNSPLRRVGLELPQDKKSEISILTILTVIIFILFFIQVLTSGSLHARGYLILPILLVATSAIYIHYIWKVKNRKLYNLLIVVVISFLSIWLVGSYNVSSNQSLHKASLMNPIEEVIEYVNNSTREENKSFSVFTYDPVLTYYLIRADLSDRVNIYSPYKNESQSLISSQSEPRDKISNYSWPVTKIFYIESYPGSLMRINKKLEEFKHSLFFKGTQNGKPIKFGFDENSERKRRFFPLAGVLDWSYTIYIIDYKSELDPNKLSTFNSFKVF